MPDHFDKAQPMIFLEQKSKIMAKETKQARKMYVDDASHTELFEIAVSQVLNNVRTDRYWQYDL